MNPSDDKTHLVRSILMGRIVTGLVKLSDASAQLELDAGNGKTIGLVIVADGDQLRFRLRD